MRFRCCSPPPVKSPPRTPPCGNTPGSGPNSPAWRFSGKPSASWGSATLGNYSPSGSQRSKPQSLRTTRMRIGPGPPNSGWSWSLTLANSCPARTSSRFTCRKPRKPPACSTPNCWRRPRRGRSLSTPPAVGSSTSRPWPTPSGPGTFGARASTCSPPSRARTAPCLTCRKSWSPRTWGPPPQRRRIGPAPTWRPACSKP